jgi:predicted GTPase
MLIDTCSFFNDCQRAWSFGDDLKEFRKFIMPDKSQQFWEAETDNLPTGIDNLRILICGNNGVGKSTLINRVFGIKNESDHVVFIWYDTLAVTAAYTTIDGCP